MSAVGILLAILLAGAGLCGVAAAVLAGAAALDRHSDRENRVFDALSAWSACDSEGATVDELAVALRVRGALGRAGLVLALGRLLAEGRVELLPAGGYRTVTR